MNISPPSTQWAPVSSTERHRDLDVLRGVALFGVLLINLLTGFRVSLFAHILSFHTHPGWANYATDIVAAWVFEFKAFTLFSFLFGVGAAIQEERARSRGINARRFLARRFAVLLAFGLCHAFLIWNGDILTLYAICGLLLLPLINLPVRRLVVFGIAAIALMFTPLFNVPFPAEAELRAHAAAATQVYATGGWVEILALRWREAWRFIAPLLIGSLPKTFGLMLLGVAAWRAGILKRPAEHRGLLRAICGGTGVIGAVSTTLLVRSESTGFPPPISSDLLQASSYLPLAFAFGAGLALWLDATRAGPVRQSLAAAGQMALTNYLAQSMIFSVLFYGFGLGLFGRLGSAVAALIGVIVFAGQLAASYWWLRHYRFGPAEWLWRSLTYGRRQPMSRTTAVRLGPTPG